MMREEWVVRLCVRVCVAGRKAGMAAADAAGCNDGARVQPTTHQAPLTHIAPLMSQGGSHVSGTHVPFSQCLPITHSMLHTLTGGVTTGGSTAWLCV